MSTVEAICLVGWGAIGQRVAALLKERGWVDMHMPSAEFAAFLDAEKMRIDAILADLGFGL